MGDIVDELNAADKWLPVSNFTSLYSVGAEEIVRLRAEIEDLRILVAEANADADRADGHADKAEAEADRWKADADRLAAEVMRLRCACEPSSGYRCTKCVVLDLHDREVEAR